MVRDGLWKSIYSGLKRVMGEIHKGKGDLNIYLRR